MLGRDAVIGLIGLVGSGVLLLTAQGLPTPALVPIGPGFYPRILFAVMAALSVLLLVSGLRHRQGTPAEPASHRLVLITFAIFIAYLFLLPALGYRLATVLFVGGLQAALDPPRGARWAVVLVIALATSLVTYYVFEVYLSVLLPRGRLTGF